MKNKQRAWGTTVAHGRVTFQVWAPVHDSMSVRLMDHADMLPMTSVGDGWYELVTDQARHGSRYWFVLPSGEHVPDPASRYQPLDVAGPSEVIDPSFYEWRNQAWRGRPWHEAVIYELHVGAFSAEGTFRAIIDKLPHLVALGVTTIELMPVADFPGAYNWGYDGVMLYAPDATYGQPEDLQALVDAAHQAGLMVFLDVVYNHFGPHGNRLAAFAPMFFTDRHQTPWGGGINFDGDANQPVRDFFIDNALFWLQAYRFDGLRFDAVHAIQDNSSQHIMDAVATAVKERLGDRHIHLILENEHNEAHRLQRRDGKPALFTAQWNDDVHHGLHTAITGATDGYYADYQGDAQKLARSLAEGFAFQGEVMPYRGSPRGEPSAALPPTAFVSFTQNHDQVGNRAFGDRLNTHVAPDALRAITAVALLLPQIPMLFMGEEWGETQPFPFFCDFQDDLAEAVRNGRRGEFARFPEFSHPEARERIPDPISPATFASAKLRWGDIDHAAQRTLIDHYKILLAIRHREVMPRLPKIERGGAYQVMPSGAIQVKWQVGETELLTLVTNLRPEAASYESVAIGHVLWKEGDWDNGLLSPWFVQWSVSTP